VVLAGVEEGGGVGKGRTDEVLARVGKKGVDVSLAKVGKRGGFSWC
jgi:hypothetical protein